VLRDSDNNNTTYVHKQKVLLHSYITEECKGSEQSLLSDKKKIKFFFAIYYFLTAVQWSLVRGDKL